MSWFGVNLDMGDIFLRWSGPIGRRIGYIVKLKKNMESLERKLAELKCLKKDFQRRVRTAEQMLLRRTEHMEWFLNRVEAVEREVQEIREALLPMFMRSFGRNSLPNFWSSYELGMRVMNKLTDVVDLINKAKENSFDVVAEQPPPAPVDEMRGASALGMDPLLQEILCWLREDDNVGVIGIYGMGGVGKTTLLKKINNKFFAALTDFHAVIWVVVSKEASVGKIQNEIGQKLGLSFDKDASDEDRARDIFRALSPKKFILLLDDIWDRVNLEEMGIPCPNSQNKSKVVFTTRREDVCDQMVADKKVKVKILGPQDAWDLFKKNVGEEAMSSHPEIPDFAKSVVEECRGLPLALITVGRAMRSKKTPRAWKHAITSLKKNKAASEIAGMEDEVFFRLKFSYDALDDTLKPCFLYCSLFPEDYNIVKEQLVDYWIGEEIIKGWDDVEEARNKGHDLIERLIDACMLESGYNQEKEVKMHDVMRDLALWITSNDSSNEFLVKADFGLRKEPELERWTVAKRVSLMSNKIEEITVTPSCPNLLTLILRKNRSLKNISVSFFQHMPRLRVLDLSDTGLSKFPLGVLGLVELRYLNLSLNILFRLPEEMENLVNLTHLDLNVPCKDVHIPRGVISRLSMLKVLKMYRCTIASGGFDIMELEELQHLTHLEICISRYSEFEIFLQSPKLPKVTYWLRIKELTAKTISAPLEVMQSLRNLSIGDCKDLEELMSGADRRTESNCSMESLNLFRLPNLSIIRLGWSSLQNLRTLRIENCHKLKNLTWILQLHNIQEITLYRCNSLEEVIGSSDVEVGAEGLKCLTSLRLHFLPALTSISNQARSFPSLERLDVRGCYELKKLNIHCNTDRCLNISCARKWWDGLEWEEKSMGSRFLSFLLDESVFDAKSV